MSVKKYEAVANQLRSSIANGDFNESRRLPSDNELMDSTGYSRQTIRQAIDLLVKDNMVTRLRGSGTYLVEQPKREATHNIAVVTSYIGEYTFGDIVRGIDEVLSANGYSSMLMATNNRVDKERQILLELLEKPIDGLIIEATTSALPNPNLDLLRRLKKSGIPIVYVNSYYPQLQDAVYVVADDYEGGCMACRYLIERGHKKIGGIFKSDDMQGHRRYAGFADTLIQNAVPMDCTRVWWYSTKNRNTELYHALYRLSECTAIVCQDDETALFFGKEMALGSQAITLVSFDGSSYAKMSPISIVSFAMNKVKMGAETARLVLSLLAGKPVESVVMPWTPLC